MELYAGTLTKSRDSEQLWGRQIIAKIVRAVLSDAAAAALQQSVLNLRENVLLQKL